MTTDDILKLIMAGTGSAAALYTISHPQQTTGRVVTVGSSSTGAVVTTGTISPVILLGAAVLLVLVLRK